MERNSDSLIYIVSNVTDGVLQQLYARIPNAVHKGVSNYAFFAK